MGSIHEPQNPNLTKPRGKSAVGRQSRLPFKRAFQISLNSVRIRFWRSMVTAGGIFLGIAFFTVVLTQSLMQWPLPEEVPAGFVRISGQVNAPEDYNAWTPVPVKEGLEAGISHDAIDRVAQSDGTFRLAEIVQGKLDVKRAEKNLTRVNEEWKSLKKLQDPIAFYIDAAADKDVNVKDAIKYGVPANVARKLAKSGKTFKGSALVDVFREQSRGLPPFYSLVVLDQDITVGDAVRVGVPKGVAKHLAGDGNTFKAAGLLEEIKKKPDWIKLWKARKDRCAIFKTVPEKPIQTLANAHARSLNDIIAEARKLTKDADRTNIMLVNKGRRVRANFEQGGIQAGQLKLKDGDTIMVADRNNRFRTRWLVVMSLLVCFVGITNSLLMAVTERFKEIGTMKCLGALDKFVVELFMLESGMMGIVASILGWVAGFVIIVLLAGFTKGWDLVGNMQLVEILGTLGWAVFVGLLLTTLATIPPALRAANMPPAIALRAEI